MEQFIGIGNYHNENFKYVLKLLKTEKPDLIFVEAGFETLSRRLAGRVERGTAEIKFNLSGKFPIISFDGFKLYDRLLVDIDQNGKPIAQECAAALEYGLKNGVPVFLVDEPFYHNSPNYWSNEVRKRGIIGFDKGPSYEVLLIDHQKPDIRRNSREWRKKIVFAERMAVRNLFQRDAVRKLEERYHPQKVAGLGGINHYKYSAGRSNSRFCELEYKPEHTIDNLIEADVVKVYDAVKKCRIR